MIRKLLNNKLFLNSSPSGSVASAALVITIAGLASRVLGLFRDHFLASTFGAGDVLDAYDAAFRVPDLIYNFLILGALSAAFIPVFTNLISQDKDDEAWDLANGVMNLAVFFIVIVSLICFAFAPFLMRVITPGFPPEKIDLVVRFTRIMFLSPLFLGLGGIVGGILTSYKRFLIYSIAPIFYNVGIIFGVLVLVRFMGPIGIAWGVVLGAFLHLAVQLPAAKNLGFRYVPAIRKYFSNKDVRHVGKLMIPRTLGIAVTQANLFIITIFASTLNAGTLAIFSFAQNLQSVPLGIFGVSFAIAVFPTLSSLATKDKEKDFVSAFSETFRQILFFVIPLSIFMLILRAQIVRVTLGSGKFDWEDTTLTFECLGIFVLSLFAQSVIPLLTRTFYAMQNTKTPFYIAIASEVVNIGAVLLLIGKYDILGLTIAFSLSNLFQMFFLLFALRMKFEYLDDKKIISSISKIAAASFSAGIGVQIFKYIVAGLVDMDTFMGVFLQLTISAGVGLIIFSVICQIMSLEEYMRFKKSFTARIFKARKVITEDMGEVSGI